MENVTRAQGHSLSCVNWDAYSLDTLKTVAACLGGELWQVLQSLAQTSELERRHARPAVMEGEILPQ